MESDGPIHQPSSNDRREERHGAPIEGAEQVAQGVENCNVYKQPHYPRDGKEKYLADHGAEVYGLSGNGGQDRFFRERRSWFDPKLAPCHARGISLTDRSYPSASTISIKKILKKLDL